MRDVRRCPLLSDICRRHRHSPHPAPLGATAESAVCVSVCELSYIMLSPEVILYVNVHVPERPRISGWPCPRELLNRLCPREMLS